MELEGEKLKEYISAVYKMEESVYKQSLALEEAEKFLEHGPIYEKVTPGKIPHKKIASENEMGKPERKKTQVPVLSFCFMVFNFFAFLNCINYGDEETFNMPLFMFFLLCFIISGSVFVRAKVKINRENNDYNKKAEEYNDKIEKLQLKYDADYKRKMDAYEKEKANCEIENGKRHNVALRLFNEAKTEVSKMRETYTSSQNILDKFYNLDVIYPKYRNIVAMASIYEYFESGRCTDLKGPNGAYNLFEQEVRMNLIVVSLNVILDNLNAIKQNQYCLFQTLMDTRKEISDIKYSLNNLLVESRRQSAVAEINIKENAIIARNTKMIAVLDLYSTLI